MNKAVRRVLFVVGAVVMLAALVLFAYTRFSLNDNEKNAKTIADRLCTLMPTLSVGVPSDKSNMAMPVAELDGVDFSGVIEVSKFGTKLPVCNNWASSDVNKYPHRFSGSVYNSTLVLGGSDNNGQLDFMKLISVGDSVTFTDMVGSVFEYTVSQIEIVKDVTLDYLDNKDWDFTFFARNTYSLDYTVVMCKL